MIEEMQTDIEKRIEDAAYAYEVPRHFNCYGCCQSDSDYEKAFKAGAKFILMLPELREIREVLEWYATKGEGPYTDAGMWRRSESALETLRKAGLV